MEGAEWRDQYARGFPALGDFAEPGVYLLSSEVAKPISREELFQSAKSRVELSKKEGE